MSDNVTPWQRLVLEAIHRSIVNTGIAPNSTELGKELGTATGGIVSVVNALELKGYLIRKRNGTGRSYASLRLTPKAREYLGVVDPAELLAKIVEAWDIPYNRKWYDRLDALIDKVRAAIGEVQHAESTGDGR